VNCHTHDLRKAPISAAIPRTTGASATANTEVFVLTLATGTKKRLATNVAFDRAAPRMARLTGKIRIGR
jgi:hypothetical protein